MTVDEIYSLIGSSIHESINEDYNEAELQIESYEKQFADIGGLYYNTNNEKKWLDIKFLATKGLSPAIWELQNIMGESNKWNKAIFKLWSTGKFDMSFSWDEELDKERNEFQKKHV